MGATAGSGTNDDESGHESIVELAETVTVMHLLLLRLALSGVEAHHPPKCSWPFDFQLLHESRNKTLG